MSGEKTTDFLGTRPWLSEICDSQSTEELKSKYDGWADTYDADVGQDWSFMPVNIVKTLSKLVSDKHAPILDAGAGTGLVGQALAEQGYTNLVGVDLSPEMLRVAAEKQVYRTLQQGNLEDASIFSNSVGFDVIIAAGVFAYAHAGVEVLNNLLGPLKDGGLFLMTIREDYRHEMKTVLDQLPWVLVSDENFPIYDQSKLMHLLTFRKGDV